MNIIVKLNGQDVTDECLLADTRIVYDSTKRITTANVTIMGQALNSVAARYDSAIYDRDVYAAGMADLLEVEIIDGRDGVTKLFDGNIYTMTLKQTDAVGLTTFYQCTLNDFGAFLDRAVCWDASFPLAFPNSDKGIITALLGHFCPKITLGSDIASIVPQIQKYDWLTKTCRQVLDDMSSLSMGAWLVDFDGVLHYHLASAAPPAPFALSTSPDHVSTFPVRVDGYKQDFSNPVNHMYVRGTQDPSTGVTISADYQDPVSIQQYGEYQSGVVDTSIVTGWDAALKAKSTVLQYAYPIETGNFTIWGPDGLECGMSVHIHEDFIGMDGTYTIRQLTMQWIDQSLVQYTAQFGAAQPDLETVLRILDQRTKWATSNVPVSVSTPGPPPPGSVSDASIVPGGLSASSINSISATTIQGFITSGQIISLNAATIFGTISAGQGVQIDAGTIAGVITADHIGGVNATLIQGFLQANQIQTVNAGTIQGVILSNQLANGIIDSLSKFATPLTPVQIIKNGDPWPPTMPNANFPPNSFFYYQPDGNFYQITPDGRTWTVNNNPQGSLMSFFNIGAIKAQSIVGLIAAGQIQSITAGQITGQISSSQIGSINVSTLVGQLTVGMSASINANAVQGSIVASQIATVNANAIQGTLSAAQIGTIQAGSIGSVNAATITIGQIQDSQIFAVSGTKVSVGSMTTDKFAGASIDVGGLSGQAGRIRVFDGGGTVRAQIGDLSTVGIGTYGGWFQVFAAGGTSYSNAPIYTDTGGNLHISSPTITNATLSGSTITNPSINVSGQITTSTSTFDQTYSSLAIINSNPPDQTSFISRGLVLYYNGTKIGSLVRSPSGGWMTLEFSTGGAYVIIEGGSGAQNPGVRSDQGYWVGFTRVINSAGQWTGAAIPASSVGSGYPASFISGSIGMGNLPATWTNAVSATSYGGAFFGGAGVNVGSNGIGGGSLNVGNGPVTCGTISCGGIGGQAITCPNSQIAAQSFGIYGVANGINGDPVVGGVTLHFRGGLYTGFN